MLSLGPKARHAPLTRPPTLKWTIRHPRSSSTSTGRVIASIDGGRASGKLDPIPQDAKGQAQDAFRKIGFVIRTVLYGAVGVGMTAATGFLGLHLWVEHLELPLGSRGEDADRQAYGWADELECWGSGFSGKGTDPRIGWRARALVRAAWVAEHWQAGRVAFDPQDRHGIPDGRLVDGAYALSESRLQQAIFMAKESGLKLDNDHPPDRTLVELQSRLASVCERIDTPLSLVKSHEIYAQLWRSLVASIRRHGTPSPDGWEMCEALRVARRLGEIGLRLAALEHSNDPIQANLKHQTSERYLAWVITCGLGAAVAGLRDMPLPVSASNRSADYGRSQTSPSWWKWIGRSGQSKVSAGQGLSDSLRGHINSITEMLKTFSLPPLPGAPAPAEVLAPALARLTVSALIQFSVHLVSVDLQTAYAFQTSLHDFIRTAVKHSDANAHGSPDAKLHHLWLLSREALSAVYLSELGEATQQLDAQLVVNGCRAALRMTDATLDTLRMPTDAVFKRGRTRAGSGRLAEQAARLRRDTRLTAAMASTVLGLKLESCPDGPSSTARPSWCGSEPGRLAAKAFFERAVAYSVGSADEDGEKLAQPWKESLQHLARLEGRSE